MSESPEQIGNLVQQEISRIVDRDLVRRIRELLVLPYPVQRAWDYGKPGEHYTCWTVLEHRDSNTAIAFCSGGFGPSYPWGLVALTERNPGIGMDCSWFACLEDALRESMAWDGENPEHYETK